MLALSSYFERHYDTDLRVCTNHNNNESLSISIGKVSLMSAKGTSGIWESGICF